MQALAHAGAPRASFAWLHSLIEEEQSIIGKDWFPYGVENPAAITALLQYMEEQGLIPRKPSRSCSCRARCGRFRWTKAIRRPDDPSR